MFNEYTNMLKKLNESDLFIRPYILDIPESEGSIDLGEDNPYFKYMKKKKKSEKEDKKETYEIDPTLSIYGLLKNADKVIVDGAKDIIKGAPDFLGSPLVAPQRNN